MSSATYGPGSAAVDWEQRYDFDALRTKRTARAAEMMQAGNLDALLLWKMENVRYLTSLRSQVIAGKASILNGVLLLPGQAPVLLASGGEVDKANQFMPWLGAVHAIPIMEQKELVEGLFIGHGIGVGANEPPYIGETLTGATDDQFVPNMLFALEPLVWVEDSGGVGVRIEDMILVTDGAPRVLSRVEYDERLLA